MKKNCPNPKCPNPLNFVKNGKFFRKDDSKLVQKYLCRSCGKRFSNATFTATYLQKKRRVNYPLMKLLSSGVSLRRSALFLGINRRTVERKLIFLGERARKRNEKNLVRFKKRVFNVQIDDLITKENSKLKPLSVSIAVDKDRRLVLGAEVSQIPAFGHLSKIAVEKYGFRKDRHEEGLTRLFERLKKILNEEALFEFDEHKRYPKFVMDYFPRSKHLTYKSERACVVGQGELKKLQFDPLFKVNHSCATLRANVNRLIRKTWCTTKDPKRLKDHLDIFICFYNELLIKRSSSI